MISFYENNTNFIYKPGDSTLWHLRCVAHLYVLFNIEPGDEECDATEASYIFCCGVQKLLQKNGQQKNVTRF